MKGHNSGATHILLLSILFFTTPARAAADMFDFRVAVDVPSEARSLRADDAYLRAELRSYHLVVDPEIEPELGWTGQTTCRIWTAADYRYTGAGASVLAMAMNEMKPIDYHITLSFDPRLMGVEVERGRHTRRTRPEFSMRLWIGLVRRTDNLILYEREVALPGMAAYSSSSAPSGLALGIHDRNDYPRSIALGPAAEKSALAIGFPTVDCELLGVGSSVRVRLQNLRGRKISIVAHVLREVGTGDGSGLEISTTHHFVPAAALVDTSLTLDDPAPNEPRWVDTDYSGPMLYAFHVVAGRDSVDAYRGCPVSLK